MPATTGGRDEVAKADVLDGQCSHGAFGVGVTGDDTGRLRV